MVPHDEQHSNANDAIEAIEVKIGIDGSAVTSSFDYRIAALEAAVLALRIPVGGVYTAIVSTNPATSLGYGTWSSFGAGRVLVGLDSGNVDFDTPEETGGSLTATPTGTVSAPTFTGDALAAHSHGVGTYATGAESGGTPTGSIAWPAGVPTAANESAHTHSVTSNVTVSDHASHTHTYTDVPNHVHVQNAPTSASGGAILFATDTNASGSSASGLSTANPTGGVATGTTAGPSATLTHSVTNNAVTSGAGSAHTHTISWPAGVPAFTGDALSTHTHSMSGSSESKSAGTPSGTVSAPTFTGASLSVVQPYIVVYFWKRTA